MAGSCGSVKIQVYAHVDGLDGAIVLFGQLGWMIVAKSKSFRGEMAVVLRWPCSFADRGDGFDITAWVSGYWNRSES